MSPMDRKAIERSDFPVGRKGYDQAAVHEHLRRVADEMETLRDRPRDAAPSPLAAGASEQVRAILEAAEASAAGLRTGADEHVSRVEAATGDMLARLGALEHELGGLLDALRRSGAQLNEGLARLRAETPAAEPEVAVPPPEPMELPEAEPQPADDGAPAADEAGARLIALNMALNGTPREETARYLAEHFELADPEGLLDDVYARADG
jgi:hypothetical protein